MRTRARGRYIASVALAAITAGAAVLLATGGIASGSSSSAQYAYGAPTVTGVPVVSGTAQVGEKLTTTNGTWSSDSNVTSYTYLWARCDTAGNNCVNIAGATANSYTLALADQGFTIRAFVIAKNAYGSTQTNSVQTKAVAGPANHVVQAASVVLPNRLVIDQVKYSQNPIKSRQTPTQMQVHVVDGNGNAVQGALVYIEGLPYSRVQAMPEVPTASTGWATVNIVPAKDFPRTGYVVMFCRARVSGQDLLGGSSTRRLVQVTVAAPNGT